MTDTACSKPSVSNVPSGFRNRNRLRDARLHGELSMCMYSEHGFDAVIGPAAGAVCQSLTVEWYCIPGSAHSHAACAICFITSRDSYVFITSTVVTARRCQSLPSAYAA